jgi:hypothetical protein
MCTMSLPCLNGRDSRIASAAVAVTERTWISGTSSSRASLEAKTTFIALVRSLTALMKSSIVPPEKSREIVFFAILSASAFSLARICAASWSLLGAQCAPRHYYTLLYTL